MYVCPYYFQYADETDQSRESEPTVDTSATLAVAVVGGGVAGGITVAIAIALGIISLIIVIGLKATKEGIQTVLCTSLLHVCTNYYNKIHMHYSLCYTLLVGMSFVWFCFSESIVCAFSDSVNSDWHVVDDIVDIDTITFQTLHW